jgi:hypothetical protein
MPATIDVLAKDISSRKALVPGHGYKEMLITITWVLLSLCFLAYHARNLDWERSSLHKAVHAREIRHINPPPSPRIVLYEDQDIIEGWGRILHDWLLPFSSGITSSDIDETLWQARWKSQVGGPVVFQHIKGNFFVLDPNEECSELQKGKEYTIDRCFAIYTILNDTAMEMRGSLPDFEFVYDLSDLPTWGFDNATLDNKPMPGFGAVRCWQRGSMSFPMFGAHGRWNIADIDDKIAKILNQHSRPFAERKGAAVFRGGLRGCSFPPEHDDMQHWNWVHGAFYKGASCGRHKLQAIGHRHPELVDFANTDNGSDRLDRLSMEEQEDMFKYVISAEGWGGWADRLSELMFYNMGLIVQEHPCREWFEEMFFPFQHYIPVANDFSNLLGRISWAEHHPHAIKNMIRSKITQAERVLSRQGIITFSKLLWTRYAELQRYPIIRRNGTVALEELFA